MVLRSILILASVFATLNGCGLKGPLYLPEDRAKSDSAQTAASDSERKQRSNGGTPRAGTATSGTPTQTAGVPASTTPPPPGH